VPGSLRLSRGVVADPPVDPRVPAESHEKLEAWLRYFEELGLEEFYTRRKPNKTKTKPAAAAHRVTQPVQAPAPSLASPPHKAASAAAVRAAPPVALPLAPSPSLFERVERAENETLEVIQNHLGEDCTRCRLHKGRTRIVFGAGNRRAELVFVGEGPGHDEDLQGLPFVGRAGKLLTQMIEAMGLTREQVYICNIVKCRPPQNRPPEKDEIAQCSPFLYRQLDAISPKAIVTLGNIASQTLLGTNKPISQFRGQWFDFRNSKLLATYHPAYLLRNPPAKGEVWKDLQKVMALLGLEPKKRSR